MFSPKEVHEKIIKTNYSLTLQELVLMAQEEIDCVFVYTHHYQGYPYVSHDLCPHQQEDPTFPELHKSDWVTNKRNRNENLLTTLQLAITCTEEEEIRAIIR